MTVCLFTGPQEQGWISRDRNVWKFKLKQTFCPLKLMTSDICHINGMLMNTLCSMSIYQTMGLLLDRSPLLSGLSPRLGSMPISTKNDKPRQLPTQEEATEVKNSWCSFPSRKYQSLVFVPVYDIGLGRGSFNGQCNETMVERTRFLYVLRITAKCQQKCFWFTHPSFS